jgi:hypothetical protein
MVAEIYAGLGAFKAMFDMARGLKDIHDTTIRNGAIIELQEHILTAQAEQASLVERLRTLEKQLTELKAWEAEKERYQLHELPPGVFVLSLKPEMGNGEPDHSICQACYQRGKKSVLHADEHRNGIHHLTCHECSAVLRVGHFTTPRVHVSSQGWT